MLLIADEHTEGRTEQVRCNTWSASTTYSPYYWEDISSPFPDIGSAYMTRLTFSKEYCFADGESDRHFSETKRAFIRSNAVAPV